MNEPFINVDSILVDDFSYYENKSKNDGYIKPREGNILYAFFVRYYNYIKPKNYFKAVRAIDDLAIRVLELTAKYSEHAENFLSKYSDKLKLVSKHASGVVGIFSIFETYRTFNELLEMLQDFRKRIIKNGFKTLELIGKGCKVTEWLLKIGVFGLSEAAKKTLGCINGGSLIFTFSNKLYESWNNWTLATLELNPYYQLFDKKFFEDGETKDFENLIDFIEENFAEKHQKTIFGIIGYHYNTSFYGYSRASYDEYKEQGENYLKSKKNYYRTKYQNCSTLEEKTKIEQSEYQHVKKVVNFLKNKMNLVCKAGTSINNVKIMENTRKIHTCAIKTIRNLALLITAVLITTVSATGYFNPLAMFAVTSVATFTDHLGFFKESVQGIKNYYLEWTNEENSNTSDDYYFDELFPD